MASRQVDYESAKAAVLTAFFTARTANRPAVECYKAGVDVWKCLYPDQTAEYAAKAAVHIMLEAVREDMLVVDHGGVRPAGTGPDTPLELLSKPVPALPSA